jgi:hypothetical protein
VVLLAQQVLPDPLDLLVRRVLQALLGLLEQPGLPALPAQRASREIQDPAGLRARAVDLPDPPDLREPRARVVQPGEPVQPERLASLEIRAPADLLEPLVLKALPVRLD